MWYITFMKKLNVASLFDGMSCGQTALERAGFQLNNYFASEIDKYAIAVTQHRFPNTIQLGNVVDWRNWKLPNIDILLGGSPCQGFSIAGKRLNWEDPRSKLFFEYVDILRFYKPRYFLYENVASMKKEIKDAISFELGVEPIMINSALVSAQSRKRLYWTDIPNILQPDDRKVYLRDILEDGFVDREKSYCLDANYFRGGNLKRYFKRGSRQLVFIKTIPHGYIKESEKLYTKYPSLCAQSPASKHVIKVEGGNEYRKLSAIECERLQTVEDNWTLVPFGKRMMSNTQRYKMLGNGWNIETIVHILSHIPTSM